MDSIRDWAARNNLTLNMIKTTETVIYDCRKTQQDTPPPLPGITRVDTLRILGVTLTRRLSASDHIRRVVSECSQTLYALRVLRHHGLTDGGLHTVFRSVVVAKLLYACSAWSGFITVSDRHRVDAFLRRSKRSGYCYDELLEDADDKLFNKLYITPNTHSTIFYHHLTWHHNITISVPPHLTTDNYLHALDT